MGLTLNNVVMSGLVILVGTWILDMLSKLQKRVCRTTNPSLVPCLELLPYFQNTARLRVFYSYYFGRRI